jgi:hypothetical protein
LIAPGQHYTGQLNNHQNEANFGGDVQVALWRLPPLATRDVIYVDWHSVPSTDSPGYFPVCMTFAQGIDDFNWGSVFDDAVGYECEGDAVYTLSGSGTARSAITVQGTDASSSYIEFFTNASETSPSRFETFPYDFTVSPPLHYLDAAIREVKRVSANGVIRATTNLANGLPAPDGLSFDLAVSWPGGGSASYSALSAGGKVAFRLALPETAYGERAAFVVTHPADGVYQGVSTAKLRAKVTRPKAPPLSPCVLAKRRVRVLQRQYRRLLRHASHAHGAQRSALRRRAKRVKRKLRAARAQVDGACARPQ